jgi:membrane protein
MKAIPQWCTVEDASMGARAYLDLICETVVSFIEDQAMRMAASVSFYAIFSIAPALFIGLAVAGVAVGMHEAEYEVVTRLEKFVNPEAASYLFSMVQNLRSQLMDARLPIVGLVGAVLAATTVFVEIHSCLNVIWRVTPSDRRKRTRLLRVAYSRVLSFVLVVGVGLLIMAGVAAGAALTTLNALLSDALPVSAGALEQMELFIQFGMIPALLFFTYWFVPDAKIKWSDVIPAAIVGAVLLLLGKRLFSMYLSFTHLGTLYGAAGSVFVFLAFVYYSAQVFFLGAELSRVYAYRFGSLANAPLPENENLGDRTEVLDGNPDQR